MLKGAILKVVSRQDLTEAEMTRAMEAIMNGEATEAQIGALITALRMKGETVAEITAAAKVMRAKATRIEQVQEVATAGLIMPRKSTYFYPKVMTGLVLSPINPQEEITIPA